MRSLLQHNADVASSRPIGVPPNEAIKLVDLHDRMRRPLSAGSLAVNAETLTMSCPMYATFDWVFVGTRNLNCHGTGEAAYVIEMAGPLRQRLTIP